MPAPRPERADNPLLKLRMILGDGEKPMHQVEFAQLVDLPVATVRSLEAGRRPLTRENSLARIEYLIGATFDERNSRWNYMRTRHGYTADLYRAFTDKRDKDSILKAKSLHALIWRALSLFKAVPHDRWFSFFACLMAKLRDASDEFKIKGRGEILAQTEPLWGLVKRVQDADGTLYSPDEPLRIFTMFRCFNYQTDQALSAKDAGGLLDFREWREFDSANSAADSELSARKDQ